MARSFTMTITVQPDSRGIGADAARQAAALLREAIAERGRARFIAATGASQFQFLEYFVAEDVDWSRTEMFHLDEYVGLGPDHPASFVRYLRERLTTKVPVGAVHFLNGLAEPRAECRRVGELIQAAPIDVAFIGIGENGHLAFNDPPADFETAEAYIVVALDEACRRQQSGEGWFATPQDVPPEALSMSIRQILAARTILCTCPDLRKADAVRDALLGPITPQVPASILRTHRDCRLILDEASASKLPFARPEGR